MSKKCPKIGPTFWKKAQHFETWVYFRKHFLAIFGGQRGVMGAISVEEGWKLRVAHLQKKKKNLKTLCKTTEAWISWELTLSSNGFSFKTLFSSWKATWNTQKCVFGRAAGKKTILKFILTASFDRLHLFGSILRNTLCVYIYVYTHTYAHMLAS